jgi:hypothetical protein
VAGPEHACGGPAPQQRLADARRHLNVVATCPSGRRAGEGEEARRYLPAQMGVAGDGGDGGQVYFGVTESKSEGQGVVNVRADIGIEEDSMGQDP